MCFFSFVRIPRNLVVWSFCRASSPSRLATLWGLRDGFVALQVRVGNAHERHQNGDEHQRQNNGSLHLLTLPSLSVLGRATARRPVLRVLAELLRRSCAIVLDRRGLRRPAGTPTMRMPSRTAQGRRYREAIDNATSWGLSPSPPARQPGTNSGA